MMKTKHISTTLLLVMLSACLLFGLTACGKEAKPDNDTIVGKWTTTYAGDNNLYSGTWEITFAEDGDFYDSLGAMMVTMSNGGYWDANYGSWKIRADGNLWFTGTPIPGLGEMQWKYSFTLDGDTLTLCGHTFKRVK